MIETLLVTAPSSRPLFAATLFLPLALVAVGLYSSAQAQRGFSEPEPRRIFHSVETMCQAHAANDPTLFDTVAEPDDYLFDE